MRVYVLICDYVDVDGGTFDTSVVGVWEKFDDAKNEFEKMMKETIEIFQDYDYAQSEYVDGDMSWEIWESGSWVPHHCTLQIVCKQVQ